MRERWPDERVFTYWDYRAGMFHQDLGMRIDLVLAGAPVADRVRAAWVDRQARKGKGPSDHAPVIVDLDEAPDGDIGPVVPPPSAPVARRGAKKLPQSPLKIGDEEALPHKRRIGLGCGVAVRPAVVDLHLPELQIDRCVSFTAPGMRASAVVASKHVEPTDEDVVALHGTANLNGNSCVVTGTPPPRSVTFSTTAPSRSPV